MLANVNAVVSQNPAGLVEQVLAAINSAFATRPQVVGEAVVVQGAVSLADPNFAAHGSPKGFVFDGQHVCDVKGWREAYLALLDKLNALDAARFDALPTDAYFKKYFADPLPRSRLSGYSSAPHKYGTSLSLSGGLFCTGHESGHEAVCLSRNHGRHAASQLAVSPRFSCLWRMG